MRQKLDQFSDNQEITVCPESGQPNRIREIRSTEMSMERNQKYTSVEELPLALRVEDLMPILDIGRNTAYELVRSGKIRSVKVGRQLRIPRDAVVEFLSGGGRG